MMRVIRIKRKGYYMHRNGKVIHVKPTIYKKKEDGTGRHKGLIKVRKGKLQPYHIYKPETERHKILERKVKKYGATSIYRSLMAQVVFRKRMQPKERKIFREDAKWVKNKYHLGR